MSGAQRTRKVERSSRALQAEATRSALLEAAYRKVRQDGIGELTLRQLAQEEGVSVGLPFTYFRSRDGLLDELRIRAWDDLDRAIEDAAGPPAGARSAAELEGQIRAGMRAAVDFALREPALFGLIALTPALPVGPAVMAREAESARRFLVALLQGEAAGYFHLGDDALVFALALWTSVQGHVQRMATPAPAAFRDIQARALETILDAFFLLATTGKKKRSR
jgi:AcrR family transcriptional regulator